MAGRVPLEACEVVDLAPFGFGVMVDGIVYLQGGAIGWFESDRFVLFGALHVTNFEPGKYTIFGRHP